MKTNNIKFIFIICLMICACLVSWNLYFKEYRQEDTVNIHTFPKTLSSWKSEEIPLTEREIAILETDNAFARKYSTLDGKEVMFFTVYSENNRKVSHPPEICYMGNGVSVINKKMDPIYQFSPDSPINANRLILEQGRSKQVSYYWFKVGDTYTSNYWKQQMLIAIKSLLGQPSSSALIRVSAIAENNNFQKAEKDIKEFASLMLPQLSYFLP